MKIYVTFLLFYLRVLWLTFLFEAVQYSKRVESTSTLLYNYSTAWWSCLWGLCIYSTAWWSLPMGSVYTQYCLVVPAYGVCVSHPHVDGEYGVGPGRVRVHRRSRCDPEKILNI